MRILLQRVLDASVTVDNAVIASIGKGYVLLAGIMEGDTEEQAKWLAAKIARLRLFEGEDGKINDRSIADIGGEVLAVSQFTLAADIAKGNRPDYTAAMNPGEARELYAYFADALRTGKLVVK